MTHSLKITLMLSLSLSASNAQNLVPNPSFEILDSCPDGSSQIDRATGWYPFTSSPDLINSCMGNLWQCPSSGNTYAGGAAYMDPASSNEIFGAELLEPLNIGMKYYISFKVNLSDAANCGINKVGLRFFTQRYCYSLNPFTNLCDSTPAPVDNFAHIISNKIITDTVGYETVSGSFVADSAYKYFTIGHFFDRTTTNIIIFDTTIINCGFVYLNVDDICVSTDSLTCIDITNEVIDFYSDSTVIEKGSCIDFNINKIVNYDFYQWQFPVASPNNSTDSMPSNICYDSTGSFDVILIASGNNGCSDTVVKSNYITVTNPNSIEKLCAGSLKRLLVFPNPATEYINISFFTHYEEIISINIYDTRGKLVMNKNNFKKIPDIINISELMPGFYIFEIILNDTVYRTKLLKHSKS